MKIGISTACLYPSYIEKSLQWIVENRVPYTELFLNTLSETTTYYIEKYKQLLAYGETKILSVHPWTSGMEPFLFFTNYERRFMDGLEIYKNYFELMNALNAKILVFHGDRLNSLLDIKQYFERFAKLREAGKRAGIIIAQENVARCRSGSPVFIVQMKKYLHDEVEFVLDLKQAVRVGTTPLKMAEVMGDRMVHIHISDHNSVDDCLSPGEGTFDFSILFNYLNTLQYHEGILIELYKTNYKKRNDLLISMNKLNSL